MPANFEPDRAGGCGAGQEGELPGGQGPSSLSLASKARRRQSRTSRSRHCQTGRARATKFGRLSHLVGRPNPAEFEPDRSRRCRVSGEGELPGGQAPAGHWLASKARRMPAETRGGRRRPTGWARATKLGRLSHLVGRPNPAEFEPNRSRRCRVSGEGELPGGQAPAWGRQKCAFSLSCKPKLTTSLPRSPAKGGMSPPARMFLVIWLPQAPCAHFVAHLAHPTRLVSNPNQSGVNP
jgi:hypothetical protein